MEKRLISSFIFIDYCAILVKVLVFKDLPVIRVGSLMLKFGGTDAGGPANFLPFKTILPYLLGENGWIIAGSNLVGNIALFVPIGFLAPFVYRNITWKKSLALGVAAGLTIEVMQTVLHLGIFDVDDMILNALGVMTGYWTFVMLTKWVRSREYKNIIITAILVIAVTAAAFYAVYPNGEGEIPQNGDLCSGTGGTGQIVSVGNSTITIKRNDGVIQTFKLTDRTMIRTSAGAAAAADLKTGDRVTLVVDESETAAAVLVCKVAGPKTHSGQ